MSASRVSASVISRLETSIRNAKTNQRIVISMGLRDAELILSHLKTTHTPPPVSLSVPYDQVKVPFCID